MKLQIRDIDVNYRECGEGESVVFVHGLAEDHTSFSYVQDYLKNFHTFAYDFRGHGATTVGQADGTIDQLAEDLIAFLEKVSGPAQCVGYSLGGTIVLQAAAKRPDLVRHLVLVGTSTVVGSKAAEFFADRINMIHRSIENFYMALREDNAKQIVNPAVDAEKVARARCKAVGDGDGYINAANAMIGVSQKPLTSLLSQIEAPIDVIGADADIFCPRKAADIILDAVKQARYHEIADCGHLMSADQPEAYAVLLNDVLNVERSNSKN